MPTPDERPRCFIAMPITTHDHEAERYGDDKDHWRHVMEALFVKAVEAAGFEAVRPVASGSHMIHAEIIKHLSTADMVLCDLSGHNPNVFFELGVRTSLNLPIALVRDEHTTIPFDTSGINTHEYLSTLRSWDADDEVKRLATHIQDCVTSCGGKNPLWRHFGLTITAQEPDGQVSAKDAQIELMYEDLQAIKRAVATNASGNANSRRLADAVRQHDLRGREAGETIASFLHLGLWETTILDEGVWQFRFELGGRPIDEAKLLPLQDRLAMSNFRIAGQMVDSREFCVFTIEDADIYPAPTI